MALPSSRNTTYAPGSQVKSDDLNDVQDQIIALNNKRIAQQKITVSAVAGSAQLGASWERGNQSGSPNEVSDGPFVIQVTALSTRPWDIPIVVPTGNTINFLSVAWENQDGSVSLRGQLRGLGAIGSPIVTVTLSPSTSRTTSIASPAPSHD